MKTYKVVRSQSEIEYVDKPDEEVQDIKDAVDDAQMEQELIDLYLDIKEEENQDYGIKEYDDLDISNVSFPEKYGDKYGVINQAMEQGIPVTIKYRTKKYGTILIRNIIPEYTKMARTTGNHILVAWSFNSDDWRAFIIKNIDDIKLDY